MTEQASKDLARKTTIAKTSYEEVLDATKHQDDKIGRIVTAVAFLTAASLALANMSGVSVTRRFTLDGADRPLLAFAVAGFVLGVVVSVVLLLGSITTNLTLPGGPGRAPRERKSLIYFQSIVKHTSGDWRRRWDDSLPAKLERDLFDDYVDESFNLARRTSNKYWRTNEAAALLSFALFCLGAAVVLACGVAAAQPPDREPVAFGPGLRSALAAYAFAYTWVVVLVARRDEWLQRHEFDPDEARHRAHELGALQAVAPLAVGAVVASDSWVWRRAALLALLGVGVAVVAVVALTSARLLRALSLLAVVAVAAVALIPRDDVWRLAAMAAVPALLAAREMLKVAARLRPPGARVTARRAFRRARPSS